MDQLFDNPAIEFSGNTNSWERWHFLLLIFENKWDRDISHFNMNSKHLGKCQFALKLIRFSTVSNLFQLEVVQKCLCCQLCALLENSMVVAVT